MMINLSFMLFMVTLFGLMSFISQRQHVLMCLLSLEAILLSLAFGITISTSSFNNELFYCLVILTFGACEASVALAILVIISRTFGSDLINSINLNKC